MGTIANGLGRFLCVLLLALTGLAEAHASHFRFGHLTWEPRPDISPTTVDFTFVGAFRRSGYSGTAPDRRPQIGDIIFESIGATRLSFGDGTSTGTLYFEVIAYNSAEDWVIGLARLSSNSASVIRKTYATQDTWIASASGCCRISGIVNSASNYRVESRVDLTIANAPPISNLPPIVTCPRGGLCSFVVPAVDPDGDAIRWRFSTSAESGIPQLPGPPYSQTPISIDPSTGVVSWLTEPTTRLGLYVLSVTMEDLAEDGAVKTKSTIDFFINLQDFAGSAPPVFDVPPTPVANSVVLVPVGRPLVIDIQASDPDPGDTVTLNHVGLPPGAELSQTPGNPVRGTFSWTPGPGDLGERIVTFTASDQANRSALPHPIKLNVIEAAIRNVKVSATLASPLGDIDMASFATPATRIEPAGDDVVVEWEFPTFAVNETANLDFDLTLRNPIGGENRLVTRRVELSYEDINGNRVVRELGPQHVAVLPSVFTIGVATDRPSYGPDETVEIAAQVRNLSEFPNATGVRVSVRDAAGAVVSEVASVADLPLAAGELRLLSALEFSTGRAYAGSYAVHAQLVDAQGRPFMEAAAPFEIVAPAAPAVAAHISLDRPVYAPYDTMSIQDRIGNVGPNLALDGLQATTVIYRPDGQVLWTTEAALPQLLPDGSTELNYAVPLGAAAPGTYRVVLLVHDAAGTLRVASETSADVQTTAATGVGLIGTLQASPNPVLRTETLALHAAVHNNGNSALAELPLTLSIVDPENQQIVAQWEELVGSLPIDGTVSLQREWWALAPVGATYVAVLTARFDDADKVLASSAFVIGEKLPTSLEAKGRGRLLVLLDAPGAPPPPCTGYAKLELEWRPDAAILPGDQLQVELYDAHGTLVDAETVGAAEFASPWNLSPGTPADLALTRLSADRLELSLSAADGAILQQSYRVAAIHWQGGTVAHYESTLISTACGEVVERQAYGAFTVVRAIGLDETDPYGPKVAPTGQTQRDFLEHLLTREGWSYTIVADAEAFADELRTGGYAVYALFHEKTKLPEGVQAELVQAVSRGAGLVYAGYHDQRNGRIEPALGLSAAGQLPRVSGVEVSDSLLSPASEHAFRLDGRPLSVRLDGADVLATYLPGTTEVAIAEHRYGEGRSVFVGFDLIAEATAAEDQANGFADIIATALSRVHPEELTPLDGRVLPFTLTIQNLGTAAIGQVVIAPSEGISVVDPGPARLLSDGTMLWPFRIETGEELQWPFWARAQPETWFTATIWLSTDAGDPIEYGQVVLELPLEPVAARTP